MTPRWRPRARSTALCRCRRRVCRPVPAAPRTGGRGNRAMVGASPVWWGRTAAALCSPAAPFGWWNSARTTPSPPPPCSGWGLWCSPGSPSSAPVWSGSAFGAAAPDVHPAPRRNLVPDRRQFQEEARMSDQPNPPTSRIADPIPLLPRGDVLFDAIPLKAVVMEALAPALSHGCLVVRDRDRGAVVLVRDGALVEVHAFSGAAARTGEGVLAEVQGWSEAVVTAHRLDALLVDVCEALLRGEIIYSDLRLDWVEWPNLLADFSRRGGAYAVEIFSPSGRGVTCVAVGQQALSYTDIHPSLGDPALLEAMASNRDGTIRVRRLNAASFAATAIASAVAPASSAPAARSSPASQPLATGDHGNGSE